MATDKNFLSKLLHIFYAAAMACIFIGTATNAAVACTSGEIDVLGDGTQCETSKFEVTTTSLSANDTIGFSMSAAGTFYVDCGDDGTLVNVSGKTITRTTATSGSTIYTCRYSSAGIKTIHFGGMATAYSTYELATAISFRDTHAKIASIDGSLGAIFPVVNGVIPRFDGTFSDTQITSIPSGLFSGINTSSVTGTRNMFVRTFSNTQIASIPSGLFSSIDTSNSTDTRNMFNTTFAYTQITSIPAGLFSAVDTSSATDTVAMFNSTFSGTQITSIPANLFSSIDTSTATVTASMFSSTFADTQITSIPANLFSSIDTSTAIYTDTMFGDTFYNCTSLTSIPSGLFDSIDTSNSTDTRNMFENIFSDTQITSIPSGLFSAVDTSSAIETSGMFGGTFYNCTSLTSIPAGLFSAVDISSATDTSDMFAYTFSGCTSLTSIPSGLFSAIDTSNSTNTSEMFYGTFYDCTNLSGYIPPTAFPNTITPGSEYSDDMWYQTFFNTNLATTCLTGMTEYNTGFQNDWSYSNENTTTDGTHRVSCEPCVNSLPANATWVSGTCNFTCDSGYHTESFDLENEIGTSTSTTTNSAYINISGGTATSYGLTESGTFAVEYDGKGILKGRARCSYQSGTSSNSDPDAITKVTTLSDSTGTYCWCLVDEYTPVGGSPMSLTGPWVYRNDMGTEDDCEGPYAMACAWQCRGGFLNATVYRTAVLRSRDPLPNTCTGNIITINWSDASSADIAANDAGTMVYGGDINTPRAAVIKPGKTFVGWKFRKPNNGD